MITNGESTSGVLVRQNLSARAEFGTVTTAGNLIAKGEYITANGASSSGVGAHSTMMAQSQYGDAHTAGGNVTVEGVAVDMIGDQSVGLSASTASWAEGLSNAYAAGGQVLVKNRLAVTTAGAESYGMSASSGADAQASSGVAQADTSEIVVQNAGTIDTRGVGSYGIIVDAEATADAPHSEGYAWYRSIAIDSAVIRAKGADSVGIMATGVATADGRDSGIAQGSGIFITARNIAMAGDNSTAIYARSKVENLSSDGSAINGGVHVSVTGEVKATGANSVGLDLGVETIGEGAETAASTLNIDLYKTVTATSDAVRFTGDGGINIANQGKITSVGGYAIVTDDGDDVVDNYTLISGDIDLKGGENEIQNWVHGFQRRKIGSSSVMACCGATVSCRLEARVSSSRRR